MESPKSNNEQDPSSSLTKAEKSFMRKSNDKKIQKEFINFLKKLNTVKDKEAILAYKCFFEEYKRLTDDNKEEQIQDLLSQLKEKLKNCKKWKTAFEICGPVASGKSYIGTLLTKIIHKCWWKLIPQDSWNSQKTWNSQPLWDSQNFDNSKIWSHDSFDLDTVFTENDVSQYFDTIILEELHKTRDSEFFSKNLRDIWYLTMELFDWVHAAPFSDGTQLSAYKNHWQWNNNIPWVMVITDQDRRIDNFSSRNAARDAGRSVYIQDVAEDVKKTSKEENSNLFIIHNNGDYKTTIQDIKKFICTNKTHFWILDDVNIDAIIEQETLDLKIDSIKNTVKGEIIETLKNQYPADFNEIRREIFENQAFIRTWNNLAFVFDILTTYWVKSDLRQEILSDLLKKFDELSLHKKYTYINILDPEYLEIIEGKLKNQEMQNISNETILHIIAKLKKKWEKHQIEEALRNQSVSRLTEIILINNEWKEIFSPYYKAMLSDSLRDEQFTEEQIENIIQNDKYLNPIKN